MPRDTISVSTQDEHGYWRPVGYIFGPQDGIAGGFVYDADYNGPPLCPQLDYRKRSDLTLDAEAGDKRIFLLPAGRMDGPQSRNDLHGLFEAALPGKLAQRLISTHVPSFMRQSPFEQLTCLSSLGDWRVNGMMFTRANNDGVDFKAIQGLEALSVLNDEFNRLMVAAKQKGAIPRGATFSTVDNFQAYATASQGFTVEVLVGNARNVVSKPTFCIAKLGDAIAGFPEAAGIEAGLMHASKSAGIATTEFMAYPLSSDESILLTHRTDTQALPPIDDASDLDDEANVPSFRRHKLSMHTALDVSERARLDYVDVAAFLRENAPDGDAAVRDLFGRMMFNAFGDVTNDHLGQFEVLQVGDTWELAPVHSLMIDAPGEHQPHALKLNGADHGALNVQFVDQAATAFEIPRDEAREIASRVLREISRLPSYWRSYGVSEETIAKFSQSTQTPLHDSLRDQLDGVSLRTSAGGSAIRAPGLR